jgi:hypothetical protein
MKTNDNKQNKNKNNIQKNKIKNDLNLELDNIPLGRGKENIVLNNSDHENEIFQNKKRERQIKVIDEENIMKISRSDEKPNKKCRTQTEDMAREEFITEINKFYDLSLKELGSTFNSVKVELDQVKKNPNFLYQIFKVTNNHKVKESIILF